MKSLKPSSGKHRAGRRAVERSTKEDSDVDFPEHDDQGRFARKITRPMIARMREYRKLGLSEREIAFHLMVSPSTVHEYTKDVEPVTQATVESQGQRDLGETPAVAQQVARSDIEANGSAVQAKPTRTAVNNVGTSVKVDMLTRA